ncbi:hypothetical protein IWQ61_000531 [Dispira simplex]|nr:hypothetical protein IWQ61_000531 [Dispira simplex]
MMALITARQFNEDPDITILTKEDIRIFREAVLQDRRYGLVFATDNTVVLSSKFETLPVWFTYATKWIPLDSNQSHTVTHNHSVTPFQPTTLWSLLVALVLLGTLSTTLYYTLDLRHSLATITREQGEQNTEELALETLSQFSVTFPTESQANPYERMEDDQWVQDSITRMMSCDVSFPESFTFLKSLGLYLWLIVLTGWLVQYFCHYRNTSRVPLSMQSIVYFYFQLALYAMPVMSYLFGLLGTFGEFTFKRSLFPSTLVSGTTAMVCLVSLTRRSFRVGFQINFSQGLSLWES